MLRFTRSAFLAGVLALSGAIASGMNASASSSTAVGWKTALLLNSRSSVFTSAVAASPTAVWVAESNGAVTSKPSTWELQNSRWVPRAFSGLPNETLGLAGSANDVWAFTSKGRAIKWDGTHWIGVASFRSIDTGVVLGPHDVWVFGQPHGQPAGAWHFNGIRWRRFGPLLPIGVSAASSTDVWAIGDSTVSHWDGSSWTSTSLASLLPANSVVCHSRITGILATSATSVWAAATGGCQDFQGPFVLLHFDGAGWTRLLVSQSLGTATTMAPDGHGGIWIPTVTGSPGAYRMARYAAGVLSTVPLPYGSSHLDIRDIATVPGTAESLAVGLLIVRENDFASRALVLSTAP